MIKTTTRRTLLAVTLMLPLLGTNGLAQRYNNTFIGAGSTPAGDYLRGVGLAAWGMGSFNLNTARANEINTKHRSC